MQVQVEWDVIRQDDGVIGRVTIIEGERAMEFRSRPLRLYEAKDWARTVKSFFDEETQH